MKKFGYVRVAGANTSLNVCDTLYNCNEIIKIGRASCRERV